MLKVPRVIERRRRREQRKDARAGLAMTPEESREWVDCSDGVAGFERFCRRHVKVEDKEHGAEAPMVLFSGQRRLVADLIRGQWLILLKGRQIGLTTLLVAFVVWRCLYARRLLISVLNQELLYAQDFIVKVKFVYDRLPAFFRIRIETDNKRQLIFEDADHRCEVRSLVGSPNAARSTTGDLVIFDEAALIPSFGATMAAVIPSMRRSQSRAHGQVIVLTTSQGPEGEFAEFWRQTYGDGGEILLDSAGVGPNGFKPFFVGWWERPGRDQEWFAEASASLERIGKTKIERKREFPNTIEEAFEYAEGRVYPLFSRRANVGVMEIPEHAQRLRAIDWGETKSAYVVLWLAYIKGPPGFLVHPSCTGTIKEFLGYRNDDHGRPQKDNDHTCDAVRYAVVTHNLKGLIYVYREIYRVDSMAAGYNPLIEVEEIHRMSGWVKASARSGRRYEPGPHGEDYDLQTVADPALGKTIALFNQLGIPTVGAETLTKLSPRGKPVALHPEDNRLEGIRMVRMLIDGSVDLEKFHEITRDAQAMELYDRSLHDPRVGRTPEEIRLIKRAKRLLALRARG